MRLVINLVIVALIAFLIYVLYDSIKEPIEFKAEKEQRESAVISKLIEIRRAQELYRGITGEFASNFDTLRHVLRTGKFRIISVEGDPDDPSGERIVYDTIYIQAADSLQTLGMKLDSIEYVPYGSGVTFDIQADTLTYQKTLVNVVEVGIPRNKFMGRFADPRFRRYDNSYQPNSVIKFGNMNAPNTSGNWEN